MPKQPSQRTSSAAVRSPELRAALQLLWSDEAEEAGVVFDLPTSPNIIEWATDPKYLDLATVFEYWGQYQLLRDACQIRCPICNPFDPTGEGPANCWGKSRMELESEVLLVHSDRHHGSFVCPKCGGAREEFIKDGLLRDYNTVLAVVGMRSGKSAGAGIFATYLDHMLCCASGYERDSLTRLLKQARGTTFDVAFVATSAEQAESTIWDYYKNFRERSPWFQRYVYRVKELMIAQPKLGIGLWEYKELDKEIANELIGIRFRSMHSNSAGMAGATRVASFIDELARFDTTESKRGADEVWRVLTNSLKTVRTAARTLGLPGFLYGARFATSSPISIDDKAMTTLDKELDRMLSFKKATWEFNPKQPRTEFDEEYKEDPIAAERDFGANPPLTETPLIEDLPRFATSIEPALSPAVVFEPTYPEDALGRKYAGIEAVDAIMSPEVPRFIFFDAGYSFDSFAGAMAHPGWVEVAPDPKDPDQKPRRILLVIYDFVIRILPTVNPVRTVWFDSVIQIIEAIRNRFRIVRVCFDRWQSLSLMQHIRQLGIPADQERLEVRDFVAFKSDCYSGKVKLLPPEGSELGFKEGQLILTKKPTELSAAAAGIYELVKLSRDEQLKKVFNPNKGKKRGYDSDDTAQVLVGVHRMIQVAMSDDPAKKGRKERLRREQMGGETWGGGGVVQAMKHWSVSPPIPSPTGGPPRQHPPISYGRRGGVPGYTPGDTFISEDGRATKAHTFSERGIIRVNRW